VNIESDCIVCIFNQALRVAKSLDLDKSKTKEVLDLAASFVPQMSYDLTPPQNATPIYQEIAKLLNKKDLYKELKIESINRATELVPKCREILKKSEDKFLTATKIAIVGNVIDLASEVMFDLKSEVESVIERDFAIDDTKELKKALKNSKTLVYLADNAGENIFDEIYIEYLKREFKDLKIYYFVRSRPIINDITVEDLKDSKIFELTEVVDSGVKTPGIVYEYLNENAKEIFDSADTIISKGMGNYECLNEMKDSPLFFLLKIKCQVVAASIDEDIGAIICKKV
jgi:uncharacterized protein with ATP-grasp and redox domains